MTLSIVLRPFCRRGNRFPSIPPRVSVPDAVRPREKKRGKRSVRVACVVAQDLDMSDALGTIA